MKSQSNSQELKEKALSFYTLKAQTKASPARGFLTPKARKDLLLLALSCLPEKKGDMDYKIVNNPRETSWFNKGHTAAIDTMEQNIRAKFNG